MADPTDASPVDDDTAAELARRKRALDDREAAIEETMNDLTKLIATPAPQPKSRWVDAVVAVAVAAVFAALIGAVAGYHITAQDREARKVDAAVTACRTIDNEGLRAICIQEAQ